jgi:D-amino-acid dehydrogenase
MAELSSLAYLSRSMIEEIVAREAIDFDYGRRGKLVIHRDRRSLRAAADLVSFQRDLGADQRLLDEDDCIVLEPALAGMRGNLAGGVFTPSEDAGDCHKFCIALDRLLRDRYGVERLYHHKVGRLKTEGRRLRAVLTNHGDVEADLFVMTAGLSSRDLMRPLGVRLPLCALKGYSLSIPVDGSRDALKISVTDSQNKIVYARLGSIIRIAAMVDIGAAHGVVDLERTEMLKRHVRASFPALGPLDTAKVWAGDRPATAQGKPIVGVSPFENLYLNVGHGALGFTLACGSAKLVTELMQGDPTTIDARPFRLGTVH